MGRTTFPRQVFFLGGRDLEMVTIRELLEVEGACYRDKGLAWGARASEYGEEIGQCLPEGRTAVLVELAPDLTLPPDRVLWVDHHGERAGAGAPTSLEQVFGLLGLPRERWTRWHELVAANDRGYIPELLRVGAALDEIREVRAADRAAQGVTPEEEAEAVRAVAATERLAGGRLTVVRLGHDRASPVADRLEPALGGPGYENLLVLSPHQANFFGGGDVIFELNRAFPGGWYGGALPERGFWGHSAPGLCVEKFLLARLSLGE